MIHLIYKSQAVDSFQDDDLAALVAVSLRNNLLFNITGALVLSDGYFLQFLEGPQEAIERLMGKIILDHRHTNLRILRQKPIEVRYFHRWGMHLVNYEISEQLINAHKAPLASLNGDKSFQLFKNIYQLN